MSVPAPAAAARPQGATPAPLRLPPAPRRVSGPNRHPRAAGERGLSAPSLWLRVIDHPWLDRLVRGRAWIAIVAVALLGIVAMQVALLRLGAQIGSETSTVNALVAQNETAQAAIGQLEASHHVGSTAAALGMLYPQPSAETYLQVKARDARLAAHRMTSPSAAAVAAANAHRQIVAPAVATPATTTPATPTAPLTGGATAAISATGSTAATGATAAAGTTATGTTSTSGAPTTAITQTPASQGATGATAIAPKTNAPTTTPSAAVTASNGAAAAPSAAGP